MMNVNDLTSPPQTNHPTSTLKHLGPYDIYQSRLL